MKRTTCAAMILLIMVAYGCTRISVKNDEISNKSVVNMNIIVRPGDYTFMGTSRLEFSREVIKNMYDPIQIKLNLYPARRFQVFDDTINIKINDKVFKLKMRSIASDILSDLTGSKFSNFSVGFNDTRGVGLSPVITLTKEIESEMLNAKSIKFTITSGSEFALFKFTDADIENIKKFISFRID